MAITSAPIPTLPAADLDRASKFYETVLGFTRSDEQAPPDGVLYVAGDGMLLVYATPAAGTARNTAAAWYVDDLEAEVARLEEAGVTFETFDAPGMAWDGPIASRAGFPIRSAWFRDPEGNILSVNDGR